MNKVKELWNQYFWLIVIVAVILAGGFIYWLAGQYEEHKVDTAIEQTQTATKAEVTAAVEAETEAANTSIERRTEDAVRDRIVRPKLETARRNANLSKTEVQTAKEHFNEKPEIPHANSDTWAANCARLKRVFPGETFDYCRGH